MSVCAAARVMIKDDNDEKVGRTPTAVELAHSAAQTTKSMKSPAQPQTEELLDCVFTATNNRT